MVKICLLVIQIYWGQSIQMTSLKQMKLFHSKIKVQKTITLFQTMSTRTPLLGVQAVRGWIHRMQILMFLKRGTILMSGAWQLSKQVKHGRYIRFSFIQTSCRELVPFRNNATNIFQFLVVWILKNATSPAKHCIILTALTAYCCGLCSAFFDEN